MAPRSLSLCAVLLAALGGAEATRAQAAALASPPASETRAEPWTAAATPARRAARAAGRRRPLRPLALLLPLAGRAAANMVDRITRGLFEQLDHDQNGKLDVREFVAGAPDPNGADDLRYTSVFVESDIDGDDGLGLEEFEFACHLVHYDDPDMVERREALPAKFRQDLKATFDGLRKKGSKVAWIDFEQSFQALLAASYNQQLSPPMGRLLEGLFTRADVIDDGMLNMNELDYLELITEDALVQMFRRHHSSPS